MATTDEPETGACVRTTTERIVVEGKVESRTKTETMEGHVFRYVKGIGNACAFCGVLSVHGNDLLTLQAQGVM